jgi:hypothetical protein
MMPGTISSRENMHRIDYLIEARLAKAGLSKTAAFRDRIASRMADDLKVTQFLEALTDQDIAAVSRPYSKAVGATTPKARDARS